MKETRQIFVVDGEVQGSDSMFKGSKGGLALEVKEREHIDDIIQVIFVREKNDVGTNGITKISLDKDSSARVLLCSHTLSEEDFSIEETIPIELKAGANLDLIIMQNEHNRSTHSTIMEVNMGEGAILRMNVITLHGGNISNNITVNMNGKHADCEIDGLYLSDGNQTVSTKVDINHNVPECKSYQLFKGILDGTSVTRFNGTILVAKDSQKTEAYQANNNLLVSNSAKAFTQPHLVIYADDVKCSHGATVGSLNADELFYMRSRGISFHEAQLLQQKAFAYSVLSKINSNELRERLSDLVEKRLRGEFSQCSDCSRHCC